jgi:hypothetical protein
MILNLIKANLVEDAEQKGILGNKTFDTFLTLDTPQSIANAWLRGGSFTKDDYVKLMHELVVNSRERARIKFEKFHGELKEAITKFLANEKDYSKLIDLSTGNLYAKLSKKFFEDREQAKQDKNWQWFKDNYVVTEETRNKYKEMVANQEDVFNTLPEKAILMRYKKLNNKYGELGLTMRQTLLHDWKEEHPIERYGELKNEDKYYSEQFKVIAKTPHLLEFYNFWIESMNTFREITGKEFHANMLPTIKETTLAKMVRNGKDGIKGMFTMDWLLPEEENTESTFDPLTKERLYNVPLLYTNQNYDDLVEKYVKQGLTKEDAIIKAKKEFIASKSKDLGAALDMFAKTAFTNQAMQEIEHQAIGVKLLSKNLNSESIADENSITGEKLTNTEKENIARNMHRTQEQVIDILETYVYGKKDNSVEEDKGLKETLDKIGKFTALSRLALNFFSPVVNLLGGTANSYMMAAKRVGFNTDDLNTGYGRHMNQSEKTKAFYKLFPVLMEEYLPDSVKEVSLGGFEKHITTDNAFIAQRIGDKTIQYGVLNAMLESHTIVDGKIVNKVKHLKEKYNYLSLKGEARQEVLKKVQEEAKQLKSVYELIELDANGKLDLKALGITEQDIIDFKRKVTKTNKYIIGNTDPNDLSMIKRNMWGRQVMVFRSWIQGLADERFADKYYDSELDYTVEGRYKTMYNIFKEKGLAATLKLQLGLLSGIDADLTDEQIANIKANARELQLILTATLAYAATGIKDDKDKGPLLKYATRITGRLVDELSFFVNPVAVFNIIKTPVASSSIISDLGLFFKETIDLIYYGAVGTDEEFEDKVKFKRAVGKNIPIIGQGIKLYEATME